MASRMMPWIGPQGGGHWWSGGGGDRWWLGPGGSDTACATVEMNPEVKRGYTCGGDPCSEESACDPCPEESACIVTGACKTPVPCNCGLNICPWAPAQE